MEKKNQKVEFKEKDCSLDVNRDRYQASEQDKLKEDPMNMEEKDFDRLNLAPAQFYSSDTEDNKKNMSDMAEFGKSAKSDLSSDQNIKGSVRSEKGEKAFGENIE